MLKLIRFFCFLGLFFYFAYTTRSWALSHLRDKDSEIKQSFYEKISANVRDKYIVEGGKIGSTFDFKEEKIESLYFSFNVIGKFNVNQARELLVPIYLECLKEINSKKEFNRFLYPFTFDIKNIEITLSFRNEYGINSEIFPYISKVQAFNGGIEYLSYKRCHNRYKLPSHKEDFFTAFKFVKDRLSSSLIEVAEKTMRTDITIPNIAATKNKYLDENFPD